MAESAQRLRMVTDSDPSEQKEMEMKSNGSLMVCSTTSLRLQLLWGQLIEILRSKKGTTTFTRLPSF